MAYAEDFNYWDTSIHPAKSMGEIQEMLDDFGATSTMITQGQVSGKFAWLIRFQWKDHAYRFTFMPLQCRFPNQVRSFDKKRRTHEEQSRYQMGRVAVWFVKAILTAAEAQPAALFGFMELPGAGRSGGIPPTAAELDVEGFTGLLPRIELPQLNDVN